MTRRIRATEPTLKTIRDNSAPLPRVEPRDVASALGAEASALRLEEALAPITLFAVREALVSRLQSSGGRPALTGTNRRAKIPLGDKEWLELEELAVAISSPGFAPSAGQVASVLLNLSVHSVTAQMRGAATRSSSSLARDLADRTAAKPAPD